jgi:hypothetical protein
MKKELPLAIGLIVGVFTVLEFFVPHHLVGAMKEEMLGWALVMLAAAYVLGGVNVLQVNIPKIRRRETDWPYKVVLLAGAVVMGLVGIKWHTFGGDPPTTIEVASWAEAMPQAPGAAPVPPEGMATVVIRTGEGDALVKVGPQPDMPASPPGPGVVAIDVPPGTHAVRVYMRATGYTELTGEITVKAGDVRVVKATPTLMWGPSGRAYTWIYEHIFAPCNATMFALLAFFVASAAFRAFRARNVEAALLLGSAIIILVARAPIGRTIHPVLPEISDWILDIPNNAGRRAIMMGAAIGAIATGLRVILGLERSHLGAD